MLKELLYNIKKRLKDAVIKRQGLQPPFPRFIYIIINNVCNLHCKMCDVGQNNIDSQFYKIMASSGRQLDLDILKRLVDQIRFFRPTLAITSTEPLLFRDLFEFVRYAKKFGMGVQITTNGMLLPRYAQDIVTSKVDLLYVSIDGARDVHSSIRGNPQSYQNAIEGIRRVLEYKLYYRSNIKLGISYTISVHNYFHILDFLREIDKMPLDLLLFSHLNYVTADMAKKHNSLYGGYCKATSSSVSASEPSGVVPEVLAQQLREVRRRRWRFKIDFVPDIKGMDLENFYRHPDKIVGSKICPAPFTMAQLASNGDWVIATRCFAMAMGNIFEDDFKAVWHGEKYKRFRMWVKKGLSPACTRCCGAL